MTLWDFLSTAWGIGSIALVCFTGVFMSVLGYRLKISRDGIQTMKDSKQLPEPLMPEKYARYTLQIVERSLIYNNIMRDIWPQCLEKQMRIYEEYEPGVIGMLVDEFSKIVASKSLPPAIEEDEISRFRSHICNAMSVVKGYIRKSFYNNHYYMMDETEWEVYMRGKAKGIAGMVTAELDKFWRSPHVRRNELRVIGDDDFHEFEEVANAVFKKARSISIASYERQEEEKAKYSQYIAEKTGLQIDNYYCR